jgi:tripartite-type tricarboxylate transporter receptor subunit TctC
MPYEVPRDFTPIINLTGYMFGILVRAESPFRTWADYVAEAKRRPGELSMGNTGVYGSPHLGAVELAEREGIDIIHTPFRGEGDAIPAILGGHVDASVVASGAGGQVDAGRARWLNVWTAQRSRRWPDAPTLIELGHQGMARTSPYGLVGPAGMDPGIVRVLHDAFKQGIESPSHQAVLERFDMVNDYRSSEDYAAWLREQVEKERAVIERVRARQRP